MNRHDEYHPSENSPSKPLQFQWRPFLLVFAFNALVWPAWPFFTCCLLSACAPKYHDWNSTPLPYAWFFGAMSVVAWAIIFMENLRRGGLNRTNPFADAEYTEADEKNENEGNIKRCVGAFAVSAVFVAFEICLYTPLLFDTARMLSAMTEEGIGYSVVYYLLVIAPPFVWFGECVANA